MCFGGASSGEKAINADQTTMLNNLMSSYQKQFAGQSSILSSLGAGASAIFGAGINQYGFNPAQDAAYRTQSDTSTANAYQSAKQAVGEQAASIGGGNMTLPSGTLAGINANLAEQAGAQRSNQQLGITEAGYQQGTQNYLNSANILSGVAQQYNPLGYANASTGAGQAAFSGASSINQQNNQGLQTVAGILGGLGTSFLGGFGGGLGKSMGGGGGGQNWSGADEGIQG
jgi:hypothetical protein